MPDIDRMSLKELRGMLKEQRKSSMPPVSKMKKGALMREVLSAEQILHKSRSSTDPVPLQGDTYGAEEVTRRLPTMRVTGKQQEARNKIVGSSAGDERVYRQNEAIGSQPVSRRLGKQSMIQSDQPVSASQKVAPATAKQTAKRTLKAQVNEPTDANMRDIAGADVNMPKRGRPPKVRLGVGVGQVVPTGGAPYNLVLDPTPSSVKHTKESINAPVRPAGAEPNLTRLVKPMKYGGKVLERKEVESEYVEPEPKGVVKKEVKAIEKKEKVKRAPSAYAKYMGEQRKAGYSMKEISEMWKNTK
jgi:hypothetical protein